MLTYQDYLEVPDRDEDKMNFVRKVIYDHQSSELYQTAKLADEYDHKKNHTIMQYQKLLYTISGKTVPDNYSANYKIRKAFFPAFITQQNQYLLGNGVTFKDEKTKEKLGTKDKEFDTQVQKAGRAALVGGVSFGFYNLDHIDVFSILEFCPLYDEENGALRAGVRYWQLDATKPLRATFYEEDGYTDYIWREEAGEVLNKKRTYKQIVKSTKADGIEILEGENYPSFPIVPCWGNPNHQSEIVGIQESIDCYDLIKSGFANTVDEASLIYWTINNAGGMDDIDLVQFVDRIKTIHAAVVSDSGASAESHSIETPYASREALLERLRSDLYDDFMALDTKDLASGSVTATQIKAAYEPMNNKVDQYEYCISEFINGILSIAGIDDEPSYTRSRIVNVQEEVQTVLQAATSLDSEYVTRKILTLLGDGDQADEVLDRMEQEAAESMGYNDETEEPAEEAEEQAEETPAEPEEETEEEFDEETPELDAEDMDDSLEPLEDEDDDEIEKALDELLKMLEE